MLISATLVLTTLLSSGCGIFGKSDVSKEPVVKPRPPLRISSITLAMEWDANDNWPVSVELVRVKDVALVEELLAIESSAWFKQSGQNFRQANPRAYFDSWQVVPGTVVGPLKATVKGLVAGVLFCDLNDSSIPLRVHQNGRVLINIAKDACSVERDSSRKKRNRDERKSNL